MLCLCANCALELRIVLGNCLESLGIEFWGVRRHNELLPSYYQEPINKRYLIYGLLLLHTSRPDPPSNPMYKFLLKSCAVVSLCGAPTHRSELPIIDTYTQQNNTGSAFMHSILIILMHKHADVLKAYNLLLRCTLILVS